MEPRELLPADTGRSSPGDENVGTRSDSPLGRVLGAWLQQLARTVKTCRLYDGSNPTVALFRRDLAASLEIALKEFGAVQLRFTPKEIVIGETPLYSARSREDNLALPFFRDGIRSMSLQPGIPKREVDALLDAFLQVTERGNQELDLVTLLWESDLGHVGIEYVSTEGDLETGGDSEPEAGDLATGPLAPWPKPAPPGSGPSGGLTLAAEPEEAAFDDTGRSDDRVTSGRARAVEAALLGLEIAAGPEVERLRAEHDAERMIPLARTALDLMTACFAQTTRDEDRSELHQFLPRLLHESVSSGDWSEARECLYLLRDPTGTRDPVAAFARDMARPESVTSQHAWRCLDRQSQEQQETFFEFARELGPEGADWLMHGIAESQRQGLRRGLARALAGIVAANPERLAPWLADDRWYVVRNVVHILGLMESAAPLGLLKSVASHHEFRVRREVVTALGRAPRDKARPILLDMLHDADARLFGAILHQLSTAPDPGLAVMLFEWMEDESFAARSEEAKRAVYQTLAAVGGDPVVPLLEAHVLQGNWFVRGNETSRVAAVMCLARIGTPAARAILERGARSRRAEVSRACLAGLTTLRPAA